LFTVRSRIDFRFSLPPVDKSRKLSEKESPLSIAEAAPRINDCPPLTSENRAPAGMDAYFFVLTGRLHSDNGFFLEATTSNGGMPTRTIHHISL